MLSSGPKDGLNLYVFTMALDNERHKVALTPLYLGSLHEGLDECTEGNMTQAEG